MSSAPFKLFPDAPSPAPDPAEQRRAAALERFRNADDNDPVAWAAALDELQATYTPEMRRLDRERVVAEWIEQLDREAPAPLRPRAQRAAPAESYPPELRPFLGPDDQLAGAISAYFHRGADEPFNAVAAIVGDLRETRRRDPLRGYSAGQLAEASLRAFERERQELARHPARGLGVDTELRAALSEIKHLGPYQKRAALVRAAQRISGILKQGHRIGVCGRYMTKQGPTEDGQRVVYVLGRVSDSQPPLPLPGESAPTQYARVRYRGVAVCGDGWVCPMCAQKITESRRRELRAGIDAHRASGGVALLLTFTFSHGRSDDLRDQWKKLGKALERWAREWTVRQFRSQMGFAGRIRAREITYGINGWHPHCHMLELYHGDRLDRTALALWIDELKATWRRCCTLAGLECSHEHGFDASITEVDDYVAKWGWDVDAELAKWHVKSARPDLGAAGEGKLNGYTPFDLLRIHAGLLEADPRLKLSRNQSAVLFAEFAATVKGTAQLHWTRGLKAALGIEDLTDDELAGGDRDEPNEEVLGSLTAADWFAVTSGNHQIELLGLVASKGWDAAQVFVRHWRAELDELGALNMRRTRDNAQLGRHLFRGSG